MTRIGYWIAGLLLTLAATSVLWTLSSGRMAPLFAAVAYGVVALLVLRRREYRAALIVGAAGLVLHVSELFSNGIAGLGIGERTLLAAHTLLPIAVVGLALGALADRSADRGAAGPPN